MKMDMYDCDDTHDCYDDAFSNLSIDSTAFNEIETVASKSGISLISASYIVPSGKHTPSPPPAEVVPLPVKKRRGRPKKQSKVYICYFCNRPCINKQKLTSHMKSNNCKRIRHEEDLTPSPHQAIGASLKECIDHLKEHQRLNSTDKK